VRRAAADQRGEGDERGASHAPRHPGCATVATPASTTATKNNAFATIAPTTRNRRRPFGPGASLSTPTSSRNTVTAAPSASSTTIAAPTVAAVSHAAGPNGPTPEVQ